MISNKYRPVTEAEFKAWLEAYPRPLEKHVYRLCQPEQIHYCDDALGVWPEFVVAFYSLWGCDPSNIWADVPGKWHVLNEIP